MISPVSRASIVFTQAVGALAPRTIATSSSLQSLGSKPSWFSWVLTKIKGFFLWLFCLKPQRSTTYFRITDDDTVKYRLVLCGRGSENEIHFSHNTASIKLIEIVDKDRRDDIAGMLKEMVKRENIRFLTTQDIQTAKFLYDFGFQTNSQLKIPLEGECYLKTLLQQGFENREIVPDILEKIEKHIIDGVIGSALVGGEQMVASFEAISKIFPSFNLNLAKTLSERYIVWSSSSHAATRVSITLSCQDLFALADCLYSDIQRDVTRTSLMKFTMSN